MTPILPITVKPILPSLNHLLIHHSNLIRFGDGEIDLMTGHSIPYQKYDETLAKRLLDILKIPSSEEYLICLPDVFDQIERYNPNAQSFWQKHFESYLDFYTEHCQNPYYGSTFLSRPYIDLVDKSLSELYFSKIKQLWQQEDILIVEGETSRSGVGNDLFSHAKSIERIICPSKNAYSYYEDILSHILEHASNKLVILMLGPTAKLLAYDLQKYGHRALDLGHIDSEYEWYLMKANHKVKLAHKHTAEHNQDLNILPVTDAVYHSQIIDTVGITESPTPRKMNTELISIIVPVYNVNGYLRRCLDSILEQTHSNFELILINDGSTDGSAAICLEYAQKDSRIRLYHQANQGVSAARNFGLEVAKGDYITFIDSDDFIETSYLQDLYQALINNHSDISICNFSSFNENRQSFLFFLNENDDFTKNYTIQEWIDQESVARYNLYLVFTFSPMKLFKRHLFDDVRYPLNRVREDDATIYKVYLKANQITFVNRGNYFYSQRDDSLSHSIMQDDIETMISNAEERIAILATLGYDTTTQVKSYLARLQKCQKDSLAKGQMELYQKITLKLKLYENFKKDQLDV